MKAALIAAGVGERLRDAGIEIPKPLIPVAGVPLIDRILNSVAAAGIHDVACIFNQDFDSVEQHCREQNYGLKLEIVRKTTPNSMESLFTLAPLLSSDRFLLLTVDAVFGPEVLPSFLNAATAFPEASGVLALTTYIEDEKPLHVDCNAAGWINAIGVSAANSPTITAGFYVFSPVIFREVESARRLGFTALRQFLAHLLASGHAIAGVPVAATVDVDRPEDIDIADAFVRNGFRHPGAQSASAD